MQVQDLKRWHWLIIGVLIGLGLGHAWRGLDSVPRGLSLGPDQFVRELRAVNPKTGEAVLRDIVVYPPETAYHGKPVHRVTFNRLMWERHDNTDEETPHLIPYYIIAEAPFRPEGPPDNSVIDFLQQQADQMEHVRFHVAWEKEPLPHYLLWGAGGLLLVGGLWPTLLSVMVGAGLGRKPKEAHYDLDRFGKYKEPSSSPSKSPSEADQQRLETVTAQMEADLAASARAHGDDSAAGEASTGPAVRKLDGKALEATPENQQNAQEKEFKGEFYPVAKPKGKRNE